MKATSDKYLRCTKEVPDMTAQNDTKCVNKSSVKSQFACNCLLFLNDETESIPLRLAIELLFSFGARISEVLNITGTDILPNNQILLKGLKGSNNRIIYSSFFTEYIKRFKGYQIKLFNGFDRFYIYRTLKKHNIFIPAIHSNRNKVTHAFRSNYVNLLYDQTHDISTVSSIIGHKVKKNTVIYLNEKNKKDLQQRKCVD